MRDPLAIMAAVGLIFLIGLYCWLTGRSDPLDDSWEDRAHGDWPALPAGSSFHSPLLPDGVQRDRV